MDRLQWTEELRTGLVVSWSYFELYFLSMFRNCNSRYMFVCIPIYDFGLLQTRCLLHAADVSITTPGTTKESKPLVSNINYTYKFANDKKQKRKVGSPIETNESFALLYWKWWNVANKKTKPTLQKNYIYPSREPALNHLPLPYPFLSSLQIRQEKMKFLVCWTLPPDPFPNVIGRHCSLFAQNSWQNPISHCAKKTGVIGIVHRLIKNQELVPISINLFMTSVQTWSRFSMSSESLNRDISQESCHAFSVC